MEQLEIGLGIIAQRRRLDGGDALPIGGAAVLAIREELIEGNGWLTRALLAIGARARILEDSVERERVGCCACRLAGRARRLGRELFRKGARK